MRRVALLVGIDLRRALGAGPLEASMVVAEVTQEEVSRTPRTLEVLLLAEYLVGLGVGTDHLAVPGGDYLCVEQRALALLPLGEQRLLP